MDEKESFLFKHVVKEDFNRTYEKINYDRQDQMNLNNYIQTINDTTSNKSYMVQNDTEIKKINQLFNKCTKSKLSLTNLYTLHNPYDINHIHGLRKRLFYIFNEFVNILKNALLPPVLKNPKKLHIKLKEYEKQANYNIIVDINLLISEIKNEFKNKNLQNKTNATLRKAFQIKLIQCYKLIINITKICSKTLEAEIYIPIQSKMNNLIQIISSLSFITGKYLYGELFKNKKKESFDLVQYCKDIRSMLDECGYNDSESNDAIKNHTSNTLKELANKVTLNKTKIPSYSLNSNQLRMYNQVKPKLGSHYAQRWSKNSLELSKNKNIANKWWCNNCKMINEKSKLKKEEKLNSDNIIINHNLDDIKTEIQEYPLNEHEKYDIFCKKQANINLQNSLIILSENKLKTINNVGLYIVRENVWRKFPIKNLNLSQNGCILLNVTSKDVKNNCLYKRQFEQLSVVSQSQMDTLVNITELIMEDLIDEILSKIDFDAIIDKLIRMELAE